MLPAANVKFTPFTEDMKKTHTILIPGMLPMHFFTAAGSTRKLWLQSRGSAQHWSRGNRNRSEIRQ